jgi:glycosyltransferase involved in cell wall biosynthesis
MRRLRLLQIVPYPILPASGGGKFRIVHLARALSALGVEVTIVTPFHVTQRRSVAACEPFALRQVPYAPFLIARLLVDRPFPYGMLASLHPGYRRLLPVSLSEFDVCQIDHPAFVDLARHVPASIPIVYGAQNVEADYASAESRPGLVRRLVEKRLRALESALAVRAARILACTASDAERFRQLYGVPLDRVSVVSNGIDLAEVDALRASRPRDPSGGMRLPRRAIFAGSNVAHNRRAVRAILTRVAPALTREVEFVITGSCARPFRAYAGPNVRVDPDGDISRYAAPGVVGIDAGEAGSGSSTKLLQYLAYDLAVLSTPFGLRGVPDLAPWVTVASLEDFAEALRRPMPTPPGVRAHLARYDWREIARRALRAYDVVKGAD